MLIMLRAYLAEAILMIGATGDALTCLRPGSMAWLRMTGFSFRLMSSQYSRASMLTLRWSIPSWQMSAFAQGAPSAGPAWDGDSSQPMRVQSWASVTCSDQIVQWSSPCILLQ